MLLPAFPNYCEGRSNTLFTISPRPTFQSRCDTNESPSDNRWYFEFMIFFGLRFDNKEHEEKVM